MQSVGQSGVFLGKQTGYGLDEKLMELKGESHDYNDAGRQVKEAAGLVRKASGVDWR